MRRTIIFALLFVMAGFTGLHPSDKTLPGDEWKLHINKNDIAVYSRPAEGYEMDETMAIAVFNSRLETILAVMRNASEYTEWVPHCVEARVVNNIDKDSYIVYRRDKQPWPISDRDNISKFKYSYNPADGIFTVEILALREPIVPFKKDIVRLIKLECVWKMIYFEKERTKVIVNVKFDDSGNIPFFLLNMVSKGVLYDSVDALKQAALKEKYVKAGAVSEDRKKIEKFLLKKK